jgi:ribosome-associated protein
LEPKEWSQLAAQIALDRRAADVSILDLRELTIVCDYFVICTSRNTIHSAAVADGIEEVLRVRGRRPSHIEGAVNGRWVLMDYGDVIVHIMLAEERSFYDLERLWADAKVSKLEELVASIRGPR